MPFSLHIRPPGLHFMRPDVWHIWDTKKAARHKSSCFFRIHKKGEYNKCFGEENPWKFALQTSAMRCCYCSSLPNSIITWLSCSKLLKICSNLLSVFSSNCCLFMSPSNSLDSNLFTFSSTKVSFAR